VRIGTASFIGKDQLEFCFGILTQDDDLLKGSRLKFVYEEVEIYCPSCGRTGPMRVDEDPAFHYSLPVFACPDCGSSVEITKGRSISITNVTLMMEGDE
jgi:Zn finger protein HypA/HybF involved in hydrogenase expression